jgi:hypothetical protein
VKEGGHLKKKYGNVNLEKFDLLTRHKRSGDFLYCYVNNDNDDYVAINNNTAINNNNSNVIITLTISVVFR